MKKNYCQWKGHIFLQTKTPTCSMQLICQIIQQLKVFSTLQTPASLKKRWKNKLSEYKLHSPKTWLLCVPERWLYFTTAVLSTPPPLYSLSYLPQRHPELVLSLWTHMRSTLWLTSQVTRYTQPSHSVFPTTTETPPLQDPYLAWSLLYPEHLAKPRNDCIKLFIIWMEVTAWDFKLPNSKNPCFFLFVCPALGNGPGIKQIPINISSINQWIKESDISFWNIKLCRLNAPCNTRLSGSLMILPDA